MEGQSTATSQPGPDGDYWLVDYVDIWSNHTPYPFNQLPKTYSFMVRNSLMWRIGYYGQQPRFIHVPTQTVSSLFVSKQVGEAFQHYQPDLVVSVHPLMQLVPLRVLRQQESRQPRHVPLWIRQVWASLDAVVRQQRTWL
ncbi:hypothetical protein WJX75_005143 [Coccomyxa subellipsoidea]|uniref:Diacylglycerol glucosyltransferase N-terminal domain-containing protein n=1 Tax=Coccomyxa subellipsoidea TaxID=248742 RepID=A0ABR2YYB2_9CHLO